MAEHPDNRDFRKCCKRVIEDSYTAYAKLAKAAIDPTPVSGWTHNFYRYPARFSPRFAAAVISEFSKPGDIVGDPYMGGGTTVVEAVAAGRHAIGSDLNSLAAFITRVKITALSEAERTIIRTWAKENVSRLSYRTSLAELESMIDGKRTRNLSLPRARFIKKLLALAIASTAAIPSQNASAFVRCALLRVGQWALDGRRRHTPLEDFRQKLRLVVEEMLGSLRPPHRPSTSRGWKGDHTKQGRD